MTIGFSIFFCSGDSGKKNVYYIYWNSFLLPYIDCKCNFLSFKLRAICVLRVASVLVSCNICEYKKKVTSCLFSTCLHSHSLRMVIKVGCTNAKFYKIPKPLENTFSKQIRKSPKT